MHDKSLGKRLFLICPTENTEQLIRNHFTGEAFFCTALGGYFQFDFNTQSNLWDLICKNNINQIVFVSSIDNVFYKQAFKRNIKHSYHIDNVLSETKKNIFEHSLHSNIFSSNFYLLAARHLTNQKKRLLSTNYLGSNLKREQVSVKAYVYQPKDNSFYSPRGIKEKEYLTKNIVYN